MPRKKVRKITYYFVAETSVSVDVPKDYPKDSEDWSVEQWQELFEAVEEKVCDECAYWEASATDDPEIIEEYEY